MHVRQGLIEKFHHSSWELRTKLTSSKRLFTQKISASSRAGRNRWWVAVKTCLHLHFKRLQKPKIHHSLRRKHNVFVACEGCSRRAGTRACNGTDCGTLSTTGERPNQSPGASTATNHCRCPFAFPLHGPRGGRGAHLVFVAIDTDRIEHDLQLSAALELAQRSRFGDCSSRFRSLRYDNLTVDSYRLRDRGTERIAAVGGLCI